MGLMERLQNANRQPGHIVPDDMTESVNSQGQRSEVLTFIAGTAHFLRQGRKNPLRIAVPAYESFTSDGTADNTETFSLTHSVVDTPVTESVVVWINGTYYGRPDSTDYGADEIDVTDDGTGNTIHVYYVSDAAASIEIRKSVPASSSDSSQVLYNSNLGLVHGTDQVEQPEFLTLSETTFHPWLGADMEINVYINAPYTIRWSDPDGDGTEPTNALLNVPVFEGQSEVRGLTSVIKQDMGQV